MLFRSNDTATTEIYTLSLHDALPISLVMSLWKVPDDATRDLMVHFYKELQAGKSRIDALRAAQQFVRWSHPDPYYWGAFVLQGDALSPLAWPPQ